MNGEYFDLTPCAHCGKGPQMVTRDEVEHYTHVDPCLGVIPGVVQACCGHGDPDDAYVVIAPGYAPGTMVPDIPPLERVTLRYDEAVAYFDKIGVGHRA